MPIYEYTCLDCGEHFEALRSMKDADTAIPCKKCEGTRTTRGISVFFAQSSGKVSAGYPATAGGSSASGCAGCAGGSCASCGH